MKFSQSFLPTLAVLSGQALAFPASMLEAMQNNPELQAEALGKRQAFGVNVHFDPKTQYVSTSGANKFVAPGPNDIRGPCPGLNALANHGYLPHNGVADIAQFIAATNRVFGMGLDLAGFLAVYGAVFDGDVLGWSIGGPQPASLVSPLAGLAGQPQGLTGSHNKYESDASPTRGDLYLNGQNYEVILDQFKNLYALQGGETEESSNYNIEVVGAYRVRRFQESESRNPYFFNAPFAGLLVQPAAYTFIYRFMANKSAEYPEGRLSQNVLKSFYSITGDKPEDFKYTVGHERIPDNWYKRAIGDEYTILFFLTDVIAEAASNPQFLDIGGNFGKPDTFTPIDIQNVTGGVYSAQSLLKGDNLQCFTFELLTQAAPDILEGSLIKLGEALGPLNKVVLGALTGLGCPQLLKGTYQELQGQMQKYPGFTKSVQDHNY